MNRFTKWDCHVKMNGIPLNMEYSIMTQILLDANLARQLKSSAAPLELCDPNSNVVGFFTPAKKSKFEIPFSEDEVQKSKKKTGGRSLADILADLEKS